MQPPAVPSVRAFFLQVIASAAVGNSLQTWVATGSAGLLLVGFVEQDGLDHLPDHLVSLALKSSRAFWKAAQQYDRI